MFGPAAVTMVTPSQSAAAPSSGPLWPLLVVYPLSTIFFWTCYLYAIAPLSRRFLPQRYSAFSELNERCWRQNVLSGLHTCLSASCLLGALVCDGSLAFGDARLYPHDSFLLYLDISMSLGYFSFSLPMSIRMAKAGFPYGSRTMVVHHTLVVIAQTTFLLTRYPSGFMAASGFLFELTNLVFVPHLILLQLDAAPTARALLGLALVVVYTLARCFACTALAMLSLFDLSRFEPPSPAGWLFVFLGLGSFYGLLLISWYWYVSSILPSLHVGLQQSFGETYHHACCPRPLRRLLWRRLTREGRASASEERLRFKALQELRCEMEATEDLPG